MTLPFEHDSLELLNACATGLLPLSPVPEAQKDQTFVADALQAVPQRKMPPFFGENAGITRADRPFEVNFAPISLEFMPESPAGINVEALSRAVERDARRFDANA